MTPTQKAALKSQALTAARKALSASSPSVALAWFRKAEKLKAKIRAAA